MNIEWHRWQDGSRSCWFALCLQDGSVFADFDLDSDGRVYVVRISFDGYGCCTTPDDIGRMSTADSRALVDMVDRRELDHAGAEQILRRYFDANRGPIWEDALVEHQLIP